MRTWIWKILQKISAVEFVERQASTLTSFDNIERITSARRAAVLGTGDC